MIEVEKEEEEKGVAGPGIGKIGEGVRRRKRGDRDRPVVVVSSHRRRKGGASSWRSLGNAYMCVCA